MQPENLRKPAATLGWEGETSLRDVLRIVFRHKWKMVLFFAVVLVATVVLTYIAPEIYQSDAKLLIRVGRENVSVDPSVVGPTMSLSQNRENEINSELAILRSRFLAETTVDKIGAERFLKRPDEETSNTHSPIRGVRKKIRDTVQSGFDLLVTLDLASSLSPREQAIESVLNDFKVAVEKSSHIINLGFQARDPELARDVLNSLLDSYLERHIEVHEAQASPLFFRHQADSVFNQLAAKEQELQQFRAKHGIASMEDQKEVLLTEVSSLQSEIDDAMSAVSASEAKIAILEETLRDRSDTMELNRVTGRTNYAADSIKGRLVDLRLEEAKVALRYPDDSRLLIDLRQQISLAETALAGEEETRVEVTTGVDTNYRTLQLSLETERATLQAEIARRRTLTTERSKREHRLAALAGHEMLLARLQRDVDILADEYREYRNNLQRANISSALDTGMVSNVSIVEPAGISMRPVSPRKALNIFLGVFLGLFGAFGLAFLFQYLDHSLKTNEDVQKRLDLPVLASVSYKEFKSCI